MIGIQDTVIEYYTLARQVDMQGPVCEKVKMEWEDDCPRIVNGYIHLRGADGVPWRWVSVAGITDIILAENFIEAYAPVTREMKSALETRMKQLAESWRLREIIR